MEEAEEGTRLLVQGEKTSTSVQKTQEHIPSTIYEVKTKTITCESRFHKK